MKVNTRRRIFTSNSSCKHCGSTKNLQIDHIYPKSKGSSDILANLQILCIKCNQKKNNKFQSDFSAKGTEKYGK